MVLDRSPCVVAAWNARDYKQLNTPQTEKKGFIQNFRGEVSSNMLTLKSMGWKLDVLDVTTSGFKDEFWW